MDFDITLTDHDGASVVTVIGDLDLSTASRLREALLPAIERRPARLVVDLAQVPFLDSTGLGVLVTAEQRSQDAAVDFRVAGPRRSAERVLSITGLDRALAVFDSVEEALADSGTEDGSGRP